MRWARQRRRSKRGKQVPSALTISSAPSGVCQFLCVRLAHVTTFRGQLLLRPLKGLTVAIQHRVRSVGDPERPGAS
jgi:hypothetical protein